MVKKLDLGCGNRKREGAVGIDCNPRTCADVIHDLNVFPYPFETSSFDEIYADNTLEHLDNPIKVLEELYRISKSDALIRIDVPYFRAKWAYVDPTHKHFFTTESFSYFDHSHINNRLFPYSNAKFRVEKLAFNERITEGGILGALKRLAKMIVDRSPQKYEDYFSHLFPLGELTFYMKVIK